MESGVMTAVLHYLSVGGAERIDYLFRGRGLAYRQFFCR
jgi:hypothetical protein